MVFGLLIFYISILFYIYQFDFHNGSMLKCAPFYLVARKDICYLLVNSNQAWMGFSSWFFYSILQLLIKFYCVYWELRTQDLFDQWDILCDIFIVNSVSYLRVFWINWQNFVAKIDIFNEFFNNCLDFFVHFLIVILHKEILLVTNIYLMIHASKYWFHFRHSC